MSYQFKQPESIEKLFGKLPPVALEAEAALLGSMALNWRVIGEVLQVIGSPDDFSKQSHSAIYGVMVQMYDQNQSLDMVQLKQRLDDMGILEQVGGVDYLVELAESVPSAVSALYYANIVREKAQIRRIIESAGRILERAYTTDAKFAEQAEAAESEIFDISSDTLGDHTISIGRAADNVYTELQEQDGSAIRGIETGYHELDDLLNGLQDGSFYVLASRPSMGKTALAMNITYNVANNNKYPACIFSLEMKANALAQRFMSIGSQVSSRNIQRNMLSGADFEALALTIGKMKESPLYIDDSSYLSLMQLRSKARQMKIKHHIRLIIIDYLQLMTYPSNKKEYEALSELSRGLKNLADELSVPVLCLSQLNRGVEGRDKHSPRMSDLRGSGSIEQDADVVMLLHREEYYHKNDANWIADHPRMKGLAQIIVAKQRNGPTGTIELDWKGPTMRFVDTNREDGLYG